ncbi:class D sortase [Clostridium isatidis]|uniref:class D sortase n=1 Tax=Clostridium isatidis TaxID=182773 RepID=UPI003AAB0973
MREGIRRAIGVILIIIGITIIVSIIYRKIETAKKQEELKNILEEVINEGIDSSENEDASFTVGEGYKPIGLLEIPSINLSQGIVEGITDDILLYYLGHFEGSAMPGERGNFAVAGHRVSDYSEAFVNLYKTKVGDEIIVKAKGKKYIYEVTDNFIVQPDRVEVLDDTKDATITLITCTVGAKERVVVKGKLIETKELNSGGEQ